MKQDISNNNDTDIVLFTSHGYTPKQDRMKNSEETNKDKI